MSTKGEFMSNYPSYSNHPKVKVVNHPLVQHKLAFLRMKNTPTQVFRALLREITLLEGYEATFDMKTKTTSVETPLETAEVTVLDNSGTLIVPILRAGLGFEEGLLQLIPRAKVGHIGMYRDEETATPNVYFSKMPPDCQNYKVIVVDPMLATGGSMCAALKFLREEVKITSTITIMVLVAVPEGIKAVLDYDDNVSIVTCAIDRELDENFYILPGIGDCGDRLFGTV